MGKDADRDSPFLVQMVVQMPLTYFKRYRMEFELNRPLPEVDLLPTQYVVMAWRSRLLDAHAEAKYRSFCCELDANVFPCLGELDGCRRLMSEISSRANFIPTATWLLVHDHEDEPCGTVQGIQDGEFTGAIQNLGITPEHRGLGLGTFLLMQAMRGFQEKGLKLAYLEVTARNTGAVRLYERLGFHRTKTVYKAVEVSLVY
jgi:ribosomal protein S18 acetylase RimI-like enzyme